MLSVRDLTTNDPDEFAHALRPNGSPFLVRERGQFKARVKKVDFDHVWTQHTEEHLSRAWRLQLSSERLGLAFCDAGMLGRTWRGSSVSGQRLMVVRCDSDGWDQVSADACWRSMSLPFAY